MSDPKVRLFAFFAGVSEEEFLGAAAWRFMLSVVFCLRRLMLDNWQLLLRAWPTPRGAPVPVQAVMDILGNLYNTEEPTTLRVRWRSGLRDCVAALIGLESGGRLRLHAGEEGRRMSMRRACNRRNQNPTRAGGDQAPGASAEGVAHRPRHRLRRFPAHRRARVHGGPLPSGPDRRTAAHRRRPRADAKQHRRPRAAGRCDC